MRKRIFLLMIFATFFFNNSSSFLYAENINYRKIYEKHEKIDSTELVIKFIKKIFADEPFTFEDELTFFPGFGGHIGFMLYEYKGLLDFGNRQTFDEIDLKIKPKYSLIGELIRSNREKFTKGYKLSELDVNIFETKKTKYLNNKLKLSERPSGECNIILQLQPKGSNELADKKGTIIIFNLLEAKKIFPAMIQIDGEFLPSILGTTLSKDKKTVISKKTKEFLKNIKLN